MAKKVVGKITAKRLKSKPMAYIDSKGNVMHYGSRQKKRLHKILQKAAVSKDLLKQRKELKITLFVQGKKIMKGKNALNGLRRRGGKRRGR